tara:strand:- start:4078 stop:4371 length:294 start_codon:yes stop_codon:yes gene_type:complete
MKKPYYVVYTKEGCGYCDKAVGLLSEKQEVYVVTDLTHNEELFEEVKKTFDHNTTPVVIKINEDDSSVSLIGGFSELNELLVVEEVAEDDTADDEQD